MDIKSKTTKEEKNKERILINLKKKTETLKNLKEIIKKCNAKDYGSIITVSEIFIHTLNSIKDTDIKILQKASITTDEDLLKYEWSKDQSKNKEKLNFNTWLIRKLKLKPISKKEDIPSFSNSN